MKDCVNILLVDDRPEGLVTLEAVLADPDYNLIKAGSGSEALAQVLSYDFALILMDVQMPDMDGFETATIIKQREKSKNIPIIFLTAINKADHFVSTGYSVGAVDYLFKPFDPHILRSKVSVFVDLYRKTRLLQTQSEVLREIEIRDRMRTLNELELEGRRRYQNLADAIPQVVFRATKSGDIEYFNQFWHLYSGLSSKHNSSNAWRSVVQADDLALIDLKWNEAQISMTGFECECRIKNGQNGAYRWHLLRVVPEFNSFSVLLCWIGVATDIHDQKLVQEELLRAKRVADVASETKSRFLANMSHEIRTPLGAILGFSEILATPEMTVEDKSEAISAIRRNGEQLSKIISEILDLSKVEAGKLELERIKVSLAELIGSVKTIKSLVAREKGLELNFNLASEIPIEIETDPTRLQQILINVIGNAIKFSPAGQVTVTTEFSPGNGLIPDQVRFSVNDSGPGLTATQINDLFQPFTQVDTSMTRKYGGTGLGLALSRRLARALGGDIQVSASNPGEGCCFVVTVATGKVNPSAFTNSLVVPEKTFEDLSQKKSQILADIEILLVEDSIDNQVLVSRFLTMAGAKVELACNGVEGVKKAMAGRHNIVLMDIQMPELDGYDAIIQLRENGFKKPIIALTAHGMLEERQRCLKLGFNDHLTKPINRKSLIERVLAFAQKGRANTQEKPVNVEMMV